MLFLPLLLACTGVSLSPDAPLATDPMLQALPADAPVVARLEVDPVDIEALRASGWVEPAALPLTELPARSAAACTELGCVALVEGETEPLVGAVGPHRWRVVHGDRVGVWSRLSAEQAVAGEESAVEALRGAHAAGAPLLDPTELQGLVPDGELWMLARNAGALVSLAESKGIALPELPEEIALVEALALAGDLDGETLSWTARLTATDPALAKRAAVAAEGLLAGHSLLDRAEVVRVGGVVELRGGHLSLSELEAALRDAGVLP